MADIFNLLRNGQLVEKKEIVEGLNPPQEFNERIKSFFPEQVYNISSDSLLYKLLYSILGDAGVNGAKKAFLVPKLYKALSTTNFTDIDSLFANSFQLARLNKEIYTYDPYNELLTQPQWSEIRTKDSAYKSRSQDYMRGINQGLTIDGLKLLARAATGYECEIFERWRYLDDMNSDERIGIPNYGNTTSYQEFVIVPQTDSLSPSEHKRISSILNRLKPANCFFTVDVTDSGLQSVAVQQSKASTHHFYVQRSVTGNGVIDYSYDKGNNWIKTGITQDAPTGVFGDRAESAIYLTINDITASTFHIGNFSTDQQNLFYHLRKKTNSFPYEAHQAISDTPDIYKMKTPWLPRNAGKDSFVINDHYPVGYFADANFTLDKPSKIFWASQEADSDIDESLVIDFGSTRPVNMVQFEICQKPIDIEVYYMDPELEVWELVNYRSDMNNQTRITYNLSSEYTWQNTSLFFDNVETNKMRLVLKRRNDSFPNYNSPSFPWSIEMRNLKFGHIVAAISDFIPNTGVDVLGNSYSTSLREYDVSKVTDGSPNTYWQSQVNPSKFAVESIYFDVSNNGEPSLVDELYIDPVTPECLMHIYWSNDDEFNDDWDNKLWTPVPRHYLVKRGNLKLYETLNTKYIKLEFTKLMATPYNVLNLPVNLNITYKMYPSWVESYIFNTQSTAPNDPLNETETYAAVDPTPVSIGLINPAFDKMKDEKPSSILDYVKKNRKTTVLAGYQVWKNPEQNKNTANPILGKTINMFPNVYSNLYRQNLLSTIKSEFMDSSYNYVIKNEDRNNWIPENPLIPKKLITAASKADREKIVEEKNWPDLWFMRKCRHGYKVIEAPRDYDVGYYVAIREIRFFKRNKTVKLDNVNYKESLIDDTTILYNNFEQKDWRWTVPALTQFELGGKDIVEYGAENFDGIAF